MNTRTACLLGLAGSLVLGALPANAQPTPALTIAAPATGQIVARGAALDVVVHLTSPSALGDVFVVAEDPIGLSRGQAAAGALTFSLALPPTLPAGEYLLFAVGAVAGAQPIASAPVRIVVAPPFELTSIRIGNRIVRLEYPGAQMPLDVTGKGGSSAESMAIPPQLLAFEVQDPAIATVDASGLVTARAPGQTQVTVRYVHGGGALTQTAAIEIGGARRGDLNGDDRVDVNDVNELSAWLNTAAIGLADGRDLNRDGRIDALDARVIATLCTQPRCAP